MRLYVVRGTATVTVRASVYARNEYDALDRAYEDWGSADLGDVVDVDFDDVEAVDNDEEEERIIRGRLEPEFD